MKSKNFKRSLSQGQIHCGLWNSLAAVPRTFRSGSISAGEPRSCPAEFISPGSGKIFVATNNFLGSCLGSGLINCIAISAVIATIQYKSAVTFIAQLMGISWGAMAGAFLAPFLYGLYSRRVTAASAWVSFGFAVGLMLTNLLAPRMLPAFLQSPIQAGVCAMGVGLVLVPIVSQKRRLRQEPQEHR